MGNVTEWWNICLGHERPWDKSTLEEKREEEEGMKVGRNRWKEEEGKEKQP